MQIDIVTRTHDAHGIIVELRPVSIAGMQWLADSADPDLLTDGGSVFAELPDAERIAGAAVLSGLAVTTMLLFEGRF